MRAENSPPASAPNTGRRGSLTYLSTDQHLGHVLGPYRARVVLILRC